MFTSHSLPITVGGRGHGGPFRWTLCARAIGVLALLASFAASPVAAAAPSPAGPAPTCAWRTSLSIATANVLAPDSNAVYWVQGFTVQSNLRIILSGRFPDARYVSLSVYDSATHAFTTKGLSSTLADYQIAPDRGSTNPWQRQAPPGGHFTLTLRADAAAGEANTLPLAPAGTPSGSKGYLEYRVYLPAGGNVSAVPLPTLTLQQGSTSHTLLACPPSSPSGSGAQSTATPSAGGQVAPTPAPTPAPRATVARQLQFYAPNPLAAGNIGPDADGAPLVALLYPPGPADVVVVTAKAPRAPAGDHPVPWPSPAYDLRYWSLCTIVGTAELPTVANRLPNGTFDYGCRDNDTTTVDRAGYYFYVLGRESQRTAIARISGVTFLPFSTADPNALHILYMRNKLANPSFAYAAGRITQYTNPAAAAAAMGPYYPRAAVCLLSTLIAKGPQACLAHP